MKAASILFFSSKYFVKYVFGMKCTTSVVYKYGQQEAKRSPAMSKSFSIFPCLQALVSLQVREAVTGGRHWLLSEHVGNPRESYVERFCWNGLSP